MATASASSAPGNAPAPPQAKVAALGYVGLTAPDLAAWQRFATDVIGLQVAAESTEDELLLRADERPWRVSVEPGNGQASFIGWEVADAEALEGVTAGLRAAGVAVADDPELAKRRQVTGLARAIDPAGIPLEFFYDAYQPAEPFESPQGTSFVTGEQGLGHVVLVVPDLDAAERFYLQILGFLETDRVRTPRFDVLFTHVNSRHHTLAMMPAKTGLPVGLHHFMVEATELDAVGLALDRVLDGAAPLNSSIGKHINDLMVSFYCQTPSHCELEFGWGGITVDDALWQPTVHRIENLWGHRRVPGAPPDGS